MSLLSVAADRLQVQFQSLELAAVPLPLAPSPLTRVQVGMENRSAVSLSRSAEASEVAQAFRERGTAEPGQRQPHSVNAEGPGVLWVTSPAASRTPRLSFPPNMGEDGGGSYRCVRALDFTQSSHLQYAHSLARVHVLSG